MDAENYVIQYPLDAVHVDKFADLLGKPKTAVSEMVKANKLPIIELRDPCKPKARAGEKWVFIPILPACRPCSVAAPRTGTPTPCRQQIHT